MKKIGVLTLNTYNNYGNRLQAYAVQKVLMNLGFESAIIIPIFIDNVFVKIKRNLKYSPLEIITKFKEKYRIRIEKKDNLEIMELRENRKNEFRRFSKDYLIEKEYLISDKAVREEISSEFDYIVVGSDQIWNPRFDFGGLYNFAGFVPMDKRIAFSASFGVPRISEEYITRYRKGLSEMRSISVREDIGAKVVKELTGRDVPVLVDPTMLLTKEEYLQIAKPSKFKPKKKYMLTYFLGEHLGEISEDIERKINNICKERNLEIVRLVSLKDRLLYDADPSEFIDLLNSAECVVTDSFHGSVFSILLETPVVILKRKARNSESSVNIRIENLLSKFKLECRFWENVRSDDEFFTVDYSNIDDILIQERKKSINYLRNAITIKR